MKLADLQAKRRTQVLRAVEAARAAVRTQSYPMAQALRTWARATKALNRSLQRYARATDGIDDLATVESVRPLDFAECLRTCRADQRAPLDDLQADLKRHAKVIQREARRGAKRSERRAKKRARRKVAA